VLGTFDVKVPGTCSVPQTTDTPLALSVCFSTTEQPLFRGETGDGGASTLTHPSHVYTQAGVYTVSPAVSGPCESDALTRTRYITVSAAPAPTRTVISYTYDSLNPVSAALRGTNGRLIRAAYSTGETYAYAYDAVGNRVALTATAGTITYTYDSANLKFGHNRWGMASGDYGKPPYIVTHRRHLVGRDSIPAVWVAQRIMTESQANRLTGVGDVAYTCDGRGNLTHDGTFTYTYDAAGRLVRAQSMTRTPAYTYPAGAGPPFHSGTADGVRVARTADGVETRFVLDRVGLPQVLVEWTTASTVRYFYGTARLAQVEGPDAGWFLGDVLGSVRQVVDDDGEVILARDYSPYGQVLSESGTGSSGFAFTGEQFDDHTQFVYPRAR